MPLGQAQQEDAHPLLPLQPSAEEPTAAQASPEATPSPKESSPDAEAAAPSSKEAQVDRSPVYSMLNSVQRLLVQLSRHAKGGMMVLPPTQHEQVRDQ